MAGIDRTYCNSYKEYKEFKEWANSQFITFFDGHKVRVGDYVWDIEEKDFHTGMAIMNTPAWIDIHLIKHCKSEFVLDRMKYCYGEDTFEEFLNMEFPVPIPDTHKQNRKIRIVSNIYTQYKLLNKPYYQKRGWTISTSGSFSYNEDTNTWTEATRYYPYTSNAIRFKTIKSIVRHLRKQYLPKGIRFDLVGTIIGEYYTIKIS